MQFADEKVVVKRGASVR